MSAGQSQQFCVRWNSHLGSLGAAFPQLLAGQRFVDVTLACEGHQVHCHRLVLAACSTYFENLLGDNPCQHPIIILPRDIKLWAIQALVDFMYKGEVNVSQAGLPDLMKCADVLKIRGLCGSDALNLNQIPSPTGGAYHHQPQQHHSTTTGNDAGGGGGGDHHHIASTKPADGPAGGKQTTNGQLQPQYDQHSRSLSTGSSGGSKGQLLSSLHLQPVVMRGHRHHQHDEGTSSDNGGNESGNEICIKTEDLLIDEDTNSKQCDDYDEQQRDDNDEREKLGADAIRCEQLLHVHDGVDEEEDTVDDQDKGHCTLQQMLQEDEVDEEENEEEEEGVERAEEENRLAMIKERRLIMARLDDQQQKQQQPQPQQHEPDYVHYDDDDDDDDHAAAESELDEENDEVFEVREETEGTPVVAMRDGRGGVASSKGGRRKRRRLSTSSPSSSSANNKELSIIGETMHGGGSAGAKMVEGGKIKQQQQQQRTNGARANNQTGPPPPPPLTSLTGTTRSSAGSIRVKPIENLYARSYLAKQSQTKSAREKKRSAAALLLLGGTGTGHGSIGSDHASASEQRFNGVPSSGVYGRSKEMDAAAYDTPQKQPKRLVQAAPPDTKSTIGDNAGSAVSEGDGYENIICSPNFPQLAGVVGGYKAEEDDDDDGEEYGEQYSIQLLAEEIDSNMLANGGGADSEGDEILYKPSPLMSLDAGKGATTKSGSLRTYGRNSLAQGNGASSTLTIRKIDRQSRGSVPQSNSLTRSTRRPRLMAHSKEGALHQLIKSNGTPPPIAFTLRNPRGNQPRTYNTEALWAALMDVKAGESIYRASQMHKVPRKTLRNWMKRWDIKSAYPMPRQLKEAAEKKRIIKELTSQIQ